MGHNCIGYPKQWLFYVQGGSREVQGWKGAVQGSEMDPLDGPIAGLVEGVTFFLDPPSRLRCRHIAMTT